ncbi:MULTISPECIES: TetR/AcrR family transcriptional regulator [Pontibacillus]|uniref:TetR/AcrR family transcriptional regulator n=1 Tax=Pontibacillus chungwhensis TaxID=265426 RepID=A0ABY8V1A7_9BACI|nr:MULTISPECIES: TetR/AcrR family transcriptional regulator [Pontibacillus]MCD5322434.1 TetR/AcrR family transcriptional regulator [Pontibacillus sp. HN14]WIF99720.1 TetR/AcrR family transcriptional regulator [Pontibacillus chungwhensis]
MNKGTLAKEEIVSIAADVIRSKGYQATSVNDILVAGDIGKGKFFHYFKTKHDLGIAVVDRYIDTWKTNMIEGILQTDSSADLRIQHMLEETIESFQDSNVRKGCPFGNLAIEMSEHDASFRKRIESFFHEWALALSETLMEAELATPKDAYEYAEHIISSIEGSILMAKVKQTSKPIENTIFHLKKTLFH